MIYMVMLGMYIAATHTAPSRPNGIGSHHEARYRAMVYIVHRPLRLCDEASGQLRPFLPIVRPPTHRPGTAQPVPTTPVPRPTSFYNELYIDVLSGHVATHESRKMGNRSIRESRSTFRLCWWCAISNN